MASVNNGSEFHCNRVGGMSGNGAAHHHDVMLLKERPGLFNRMWHKGGYIATNVQENLLKNGGVETSSRNTDLIKPMSIRDGVLGQRNSFACW